MDSVTGTHKKTMSQTFNFHATSISETSASYSANVSNVSNAMLAVYTTTLPSLNSTPSNWAIIQKDLNDSKAIAQQWTNQVLAQLLEEPSDVMAYNDGITMLLADAATTAAWLAAPPEGATESQISSYRSVLKADLTTLQSKFELVLSFIDGLQASITAFGNKVPVAAAELTSAADSAYVDYDIEQAKIDDLKSKIDDMRAEIAELEADLGIESAALAGTVAAAVVCASEPGFGWVAAGLCAIAIGAETAAIALTAQKLVDDQKELDHMYRDLKLEEQDASALQVTAQTFNVLALNTEAIETDVTAINSAWQALVDDLNLAIVDMQEALSEENSADTDYNAISSDISESQILWAEVYSDAMALDITAEASSASLTVGMTSDEVSAAVASSPKTDIVTYVNYWNAG